MLVQGQALGFNSLGRKQPFALTLAICFLSPEEYLRASPVLKPARNASTASARHSSLMSSKYACPGPSPNLSLSAAATFFSDTRSETHTQGIFSQAGSKSEAKTQVSPSPNGTRSWGVSLPMCGTLEATGCSCL